MTRSGLIRIAVLILLVSTLYRLLQERQAIVSRQEVVEAAREQVGRAVQELLGAAESVTLQLQKEDLRAQEGDERRGARALEIKACARNLQRKIESTRRLLPEPQLVPEPDSDPGATFVQIVESPFPPVPVLQQLADSLTAASIDLLDVLEERREREKFLGLRAQVLLMAARHHAIELELRNHLHKPLPGAVAVLFDLESADEVRNE